MCLIILGCWFTDQTIIFSCLTCGKTYKHRQSLQNHKKYECGVDKKFHCNICGKRFRYKSDFNSHLGIVHKQLPKKSTIYN